MAAVIIQFVSVDIVACKSRGSCLRVQGLKSHAVTMFEAGKMADESLDNLLAELDKVCMCLLTQNDICSTWCNLLADTYVAR